MEFLLDPNHWSYLQRGHPAVVKHIQQLPKNARLSMPIVTQAELLLGVELAAGPKRKSELRKLYEIAIANSTDIIPIDSAVAERFAQIAAQLRRDGRPIATNDLWIAAIAMARAQTLVTNDAAFQFVVGIEVQDWTKS